MSRKIFSILILVILIIISLFLKTKIGSVKNSIITYNWKTYNFDKCGDYPEKFPFSIKIPVEFKQETQNKFGCCTDYIFKNPELNLKITCGDGFGGGGCGVINDKIQDKFKANNKEISGCLEKIKETGKLSLWLTYIDANKNPLHKPSLSITAKGEDTLKNRQLINTVLSNIVIKE